MADSIESSSDAELLAIVIQVIEAISASPTNFGLTPGFVTSLELAKDTYETDLNSHNSKQAAAKAQTLVKDASRAVIVSLIRDVRNSGKNAKASPAEMASLGIPSSSAAAPANATVPLTQVDTSKRMQHTISFRDAASESNKRKPRGVVGAEIWVKIGEPAPGNQKDCEFLSLDTQSPYVAMFSPEDAGKTAHFMLRWAMRDASVSAWGETVSATITG